MAKNLVPEGKLDIAAVGGLHKSFLDLVGHDIVLDLSNVSHLGALSVQTCIAAARHSKNSGHGFRIINATDHVLKQIRSMGLTPETIAEGVL